VRNKRRTRSGRTPGPGGSSLGSPLFSFGAVFCGAGCSRAHCSGAHCSWAISSVALLLLALSACQPPTPAVHRMEIGEGWTFAGSDTFTAGFPAQVPGTIHTDLLANGLIPDPFWRDNEMKLQWVGERNWSYKNIFELRAEQLEADRVEMVFHGLDTFADVVLNGDTILRADNMFRIWEVDVTRQLRVGENRIQVNFRSPLPEALAAYNALPYRLPAGNDRGAPPSRVFVRKAAYHYGWDWGPRFVTQGIWHPVELVAWRDARIRDVQITTDSIAPEEAILTAQVAVEATRAEADRRAAGGAVPVRVSISSPDNAFSTVTYEAVLEPGLNHYSLPFQIPDPRLWWPNGLGEHHLYPVRVSLDTGLRTDTLDTRVGIRSVELITEPDEMGESFQFRVNGIPIFMKGANYIPLDHFSPRATREDYESLFRDVVAANMNMLRVWGGGIYEEDIFYDLADETGILIWQDFMFANGMYPGDSAFLANVEEEARQQVRRLRRHPSLALWCGNNEMEEGWQRWGWADAYDNPEDSAAVRNAYDAIFHDLLPGIVEEEDPSRRYWPSSPALGWGDPESLIRGDSHYWGVWHGREPFQVLTEKLPRFSSEFGFQAFPSMSTIEAFTEPQDRSISNPVLQVHQKHPMGNELILEYMERDYPVPRFFQDFVYVSQLLQARGMRIAFEAQRRAVPRTMGTLYWQLNDTWPGVSWSGRDYFGRWKALHYAARAAFKPLLVSPFLKGDTAEVWVIAPERTAVEGRLVLSLLDFQGGILWGMPLDVRVPAGESVRVWSTPVAELLAGVDPTSVVLSASLTSGEEEAGTSRPPAPPDSMEPGGSSVSIADPSATVWPEVPALLYFAPPGELALATPTLHLDWEEGENGPVLAITTDVLAKDVYLRVIPPPQPAEETPSPVDSLGAEDARGDGEAPETDPIIHHFSENFFDLLPGSTRIIEIRTPLSLADLRDRLEIKTLAEVPREGTPTDTAAPTDTPMLPDSVVPPNVPVPPGSSIR